MFLLQYFFSFIFTLGFLMNVLTMAFELEKQILLLESLKEAHFKIKHCGELKALYFNLEDSFQYLAIRSSFKEEQRLYLVKNKFQEKISDYFTKGFCSHKTLKNFYAEVHQQKNKKIDRFWPNWIVRFYS